MLETSRTVQVNSYSSHSSTLEAVRIRDLTVPIDEGAFLSHLHW